MKITRLSSNEFARLVALSRYTDKAKNILHAVLVLGREQVQVGVEFGVTKQRVSQLVDLFVKNHYNTGTPDGSAVVKISMDLPEVLASGLDDMMHAMKGCDDVRKTEAIDKAVVGVRGATKHLKQDKDKKRT